MRKRSRVRTKPIGNPSIGDLTVISIKPKKITHMRVFEAYIVEPRLSEDEAMKQYLEDDFKSSWKKHTKRVAKTVKRIRKVYPKIALLNEGQFTTVISLPKSIQPETIEKEFSCSLIKVAFARKERKVG